MDGCKYKYKSNNYCRHPEEGEVKESPIKRATSAAGTTDTGTITTTTAKTKVITQNDWIKYRSTYEIPIIN